MRRWLITRHGSQTFSFRAISRSQRFRFFWFDQRKGRKTKKKTIREMLRLNKATIEYAIRNRFINSARSRFSKRNRVTKGNCARAEKLCVRSIVHRDQWGKRHEFEYRRLRCALYERTGVASVTWLKVTRRTNAANIWPSVSVPEREREGDSTRLHAVRLRDR